MNEQNIVVVVGDLGAGSNIVKNILLLNQLVDFPVDNDDRLQAIKKMVYPTSLNQDLSKWISYEYRLREWKHWYGANVADNYADIKTEQVIKKSQTKKIVFITHWPEIAIRLKNQYPGIKIVSLYPKTQFELLWQIKTYIDKRGIEKLQNFSFFENEEVERQQYIDEHSLDEYYQFNVLNMFEILKDRKDQYEQIDEFKIEISKLINVESDWLERLSEYLEFTLDKEESLKLLLYWKQLHNNDHEVINYKWFKKVYMSKHYAKN